MELTFEKLEDNKWYAVLPEWNGEQEDLEMVDGADDMLEALTTDGMYASFDVVLDEPKDDRYFRADITYHDDMGGTYKVYGCDLYDGNIWLCNVAHFVFGEHPETLYMKPLEQEI